MKKILISGLILLTVFFIYLTTLDKKVYYLALGDSIAQGVTPYGGKDYGYTDYIKDYLEKKDILEYYIPQFTGHNYRTIDLIRDIQDNKKVMIKEKEQTIKNALIKADLVTVSIGSNDLFSKINITSSSQKKHAYNTVDEIMDDMNTLFELLREYCKEDIVVTSYYDPYLEFNQEEMREVIEYANQKLSLLAHKYNIHYVDLYQEFSGHKEYLPNLFNPHPSKEGYEAISKLIINTIDKTLLKR